MTEAIEPGHENETFSTDYLRVHEHVFARIEAADLQLDPFPHCHVRDVFPDDIYRSLIERLPEREHYRTFPAPYESRLFFNLSPAEIAPLDPFWVEFERWIHSQAFLDRMARRFVPHLQRMHRLRAAQLAEHAVGERISIGCRTLVTRDHGDYALGPHTDAAAKFITALFYLPPDERFADFGTSLYRPKEAGRTDWSSRHFSHGDFERVRTIPNLPNSVLIFVKSDTSFHGVSPGNYPNDGRNMMMWIPEVGLTQRNWRPRHLPRSHFVPSELPGDTEHA